MGLGMKVILSVLGAAVGFGIGIATRPTLMGMPLPMKLLTSSYSADAPFKSELVQHLVTTTGVGIAVGFALAFAVAAIPNQLAEVKAQTYDNSKWKALVDLDPEIATAAAQARSRDAECEAFLAQKYMVLGDKTYLDAALKQALADFELRERKRQDMAAVEIRWTSTKRIQGIEFKHGVAMSKHGKSDFTVQGGEWLVREGHLAGQLFANEQEMRAALAEPA